MSKWNPGTDPNMSAHMAVEHERSQTTVSNLAELNVQLTNIYKQLGQIQSDLHHATTNTIMVAMLSSMAVSGLIAYITVMATK